MPLVIVTPWVMMVMCVCVCVCSVATKLTPRDCPRVTSMKNHIARIVLMHTCDKGTVFDSAVYTSAQVMHLC